MWELCSNGMRRVPELQRVFLRAPMKWRVRSSQGLWHGGPILSRAIGSQYQTTLHTGSTDSLKGAIVNLPRLPLIGVVRARSLDNHAGAFFSLLYHCCVCGRLCIDHPIAHRRNRLNFGVNLDDGIPFGRGTSRNDTNGNYTSDR